MRDEVVGHKTISDGNGGFRHEPLRKSESDELWRQVEAADARRKDLMPSEEAAIGMFFDAWLRLKDFGWREAMYCPKDGRLFEVIEAGSTGKFKCEYNVSGTVYSSMDKAEDGRNGYVDVEIRPMYIEQAFDRRISVGGSTSFSFDAFYWKGVEDGLTDAAARDRRHLEGAGGDGEAAELDEVDGEGLRDP